MYILLYACALQADYDKIIRQEVFLTQFDSFPKFLEHLSSIKVARRICGDFSLIL